MNTLNSDPSKISPPSQEKHISNHHILLVIGVVIVMIILGITIANNKNAIDQQGAALSSRTAKESLELGTNTTTLPVSPTTDRKSVATAKQTIVKIDPTLDNRISSGPATFNLDINTSAYPWASQTAAQTLAIDPNNPAMLVSTHNIQIIGSSYTDTFIPIQEIVENIYGEGHSNPLNQNMPGPAVASLYTSSNVTVETVHLLLNGSATGGSMLMLRIPAGQFARLQTQNSYPLSNLYPGKYYTDLGDIRILPGSALTGIPGGYNVEKGYVFAVQKNNMPPSKTNSVIVTGESSPYLLKWTTGAITPNTLITVEGVRLQSNVSVSVYDNGVTNTFTLPTTTTSTGRKSFAFTFASQNIPIPAQGVLLLSATNSLGKSNTIYFYTQ